MIVKTICEELYDMFGAVCNWNDNDDVMYYSGWCEKTDCNCEPWECWYHYFIVKMEDEANE